MTIYVLEGYRTSSFPCTNVYTGITSTADLYVRLTDIQHEIDDTEPHSPITLICPPCYKNEFIPTYAKSLFNLECTIF